MSRFRYESDHVSQFRVQLEGSFMASTFSAFDLHHRLLPSVEIFSSAFSFFISQTTTMSTVSSLSNSPASVHAEPLHDPSRAAQVVVPQAPLGNANTNGKLLNQQPGMGAKALLAKKMAKGRYVALSSAKAYVSL